MTNATTENFIQAWSEFEWPEPKPVSYRLYYHEDGTPKCYSMDDLPGNYIEIDCETYALRLWNVKVIDNQLKIIPPAVRVKKLVPDTQNGVPCSPQNICVVVAPDQPHVKWKITENETH